MSSFKIIHILGVGLLTLVLEVSNLQIPVPHGTVILIAHESATVLIKFFCARSHDKACAEPLLRALTFVIDKCHILDEDTKLILKSFDHSAI